jgi:hypothetical protein
MKPDPPDGRDTAATPQKKYEPPRLEVYGNIHQITQALGRHGKMDGGHLLMNKTA